MNEEEVRSELERLTKYREQFMNEYEQYKLDMEERVPFLDIILRLNDAIRNCARDLRMMKSGTWK